MTFILLASTYLVVAAIFLILASALNSDSSSRKNRDGMAKNLQEIWLQLTDYQNEISKVIIPGIKKADNPIEFVHKLSAFGEEWFDCMPRVSWYALLYGTIINTGLTIYFGVQ